MWKRAVVLVLVGSLSVAVVPAEGWAKNCKKGKPCGNSCISWDKECHVGYSGYRPSEPKREPIKREPAKPKPAKTKQNKIEIKHTKENVIKAEPQPKEIINKEPIKEESIEVESIEVESQKADNKKSSNKKQTTNKTDFKNKSNYDIDSILGGGCVALSVIMLIIMSGTLFVLWIFVKMISFVFGLFSPKTRKETVNERKQREENEQKQKIIQERKELAIKTCGDAAGLLDPIISEGYAWKADEVWKSLKISSMIADEWPCEDVAKIVLGAYYNPPENGYSDGLAALISMVAKKQVSPDIVFGITNQKYFEGIPIDLIVAYHGEPYMKNETNKNGKNRILIKYRGKRGDTFVFIDGLLKEWTVRT